MLLARVAAARHNNPDGTYYMTARPPLQEAFKEYFRHKRWQDCDIPIFGMTRISHDGRSLIWYKLRLMEQIDDDAASAAMTRQGADLEDDHWKGAVTKFGSAPYRFGHGTSHAAGLSIIGEAAFLPSPAGKCGSGVYGFQVGQSTDGKLPDVSEEQIVEAWARSATGKYNSNVFLDLFHNVSR